MPSGRPAVGLGRWLGARVAVLDAYGWIDLRPTCEFLLDYEDEDDEEQQGG
ncbi:MAG TPA: hypothetical protein VMV69_07500 [Pirellulales bacterium]|nr:hypothetical protein [Pirellulales bacterium]